ncbi:MAG TPA: serine hydrolase domain-containing protein [Clostridia bacterium]|nr:serine hydrolase domain-containing protein [Clostridia bacterium]
MGFTKLTEYLDSLGERFGVPACDLAVYVGREGVYRHSAGFSDMEKTKPVSPRDLYWVYSMTKVYTAVAALQLVEQGRLGLETPLAEYLPAYSRMNVRDGDSIRPAKEPVRIRHLFTMTAGFNYNFEAPSIVAAIRAWGANLTSKELAEAFAREPLDFDPGSHYKYSVCIDILGRVVEVISGLTLGEYFKKNLFEPLGAEGITFWPNEAQLARLSVQHAVDPESGKVVVADQKNLLSPLGAFESGGGGLAATLDDYALLPIALANGGVAATGTRILGPETIELMRKDWLTPTQRADFIQMKTEGVYGYGLGVRTHVGDGSAKSPLGEFGWDGAAGAYNLIDPENNLAAVYMQHVLSQAAAFEQIHPTIRDLIYEGIMDN